MANIRLEPPEPFDFKKPDDWPRWKRRFDQFRIASGLAEQAAPRQISTLLYCMGQDAEDVLRSTNITEDERKTYDTVVTKLEEFFNVRRNVIFERARFNRRNQKEGESIEQYLTALYALVETCEYGALTEQMLRDRLVVGIKDQALSERLQTFSDLTLEKAKRETRQREAVKVQHQELKGDGSQKDPITIDRVISGKSGARSGQKGGKRNKGDAGEVRSGWKRQGKAGTGQQTSVKRHCRRCGRDHQEDAQCPARNATCFKCNRKGHYGTQCFSKTVAALASESVEPEDDAAFLFPLHTNQEPAWSVNIRLDDKDVEFKLDTGAEVTAITEDAWETLKDPTLQKPTRILYGPTSTALQVLGQFTGTLTNGQRSSKKTIFVVRGLKTNLLGLPAITSLQLIQRMDSTNATGDDRLMTKYPTVFTGLGTLGQPYEIQIKDGAKPHSIYVPRSVPIPLRAKVKRELENMEAKGVIEKVEHHTPWCAGMVVVPKKSGDVRICVDLKPLNENVLREVYPIPKVDETLAQLAGATVFSKVDANSGFWQIPLAEESQHLTTFVTPFGRYCFKKLPFGISSAPELFQRRMTQTLEGLDGVLCHMDDVLVFGQDKKQHDDRLGKVLKRLESAGVTLNRSKCEFNRSSVTFLGHLIDCKGIRADPDKTAAIQDMERPKNLTELRRFMGMTNQLGKFSPHLAELSQPLRDLLSTKRAWLWGPAQEQAFTQVKEELTRSTVLSLYDPDSKAKVSADASSHGIGAVLLQQSGTVWKPVAYASRALSVTEKRYAQIEKEALAVTWACDKFSNYILGRTFHIETDHKPLIPLLGTKQLDSLPPRILRFRLRLARYIYTIEHVPGKLLYTADTLSRAPLAVSDTSDLPDEVESYVGEIIKAMPTSTESLRKYKEAQANDPTCAQVAEYCRVGWPKKRPKETDVVPYWTVKGSLTLHDGMLLYNSRIVIPPPLRLETMEKIHEGHQGIARCRSRAKSAVWWPKISKSIEQMVFQCPTCAENTQQGTEPLLSTELPNYPWQMVGSDLMQLKGNHYLIVTDYFSRYPEVIKLTTTTSQNVIRVLKTVFARHGIPEIFRSDNGPQFASQEMQEFARFYGFLHRTSSPRYPRSNGLAERTVKTVKQLLCSSRDPFLALLEYRATPLPWCGRSPAELSMGRPLRTTVPQTTNQLTPSWQYLKAVRERDRAFKLKQKADYDNRHRVKTLPELPSGAEVWITSETAHKRGTVSTAAHTPRSYIIKTEGERYGEIGATSIQCPIRNTQSRIVTQLGVHRSQ